ncbi:hypothetical protein F5Y11DRAFT_323746 [Daldinia sp. FL1419]|nr:hypothetical protein F5Y11DRAFT_323746 [Daldinia sp. FL1419]
MVRWRVGIPVSACIFLPPCFSAVRPLANSISRKCMKWALVVIVISSLLSVSETSGHSRSLLIPKLALKSDICERISSKSKANWE